MNHKRCPNCGSLGGERVHVEWWTDKVEEVRVCDECPTEFIAHYDLYDVDIEGPR